MKSTPILLGPTAPAAATDGAAAAATAWGLRATAGWQDGSDHMMVQIQIQYKKVNDGLAAFHNCVLPRAARITMP